MSVPGVGHQLSVGGVSTWSKQPEVGLCKASTTLPNVKFSSRIAASETTRSIHPL